MNNATATIASLASDFYAKATGEIEQFELLVERVIQSESSPFSAIRKMFDRQVIGHAEAEALRNAWKAFARAKVPRFRS